MKNTIEALKGLVFESEMLTRAAVSTQLRNSDKNSRTVELQSDYLENSLKKFIPLDENDLETLQHF